VANILGEKIKVTLQLPNGEFYELDAISTSITQSVDMIDASDYSKTNYITGKTQVEMSFIGVGDVTKGVKKSMVVCVGCGSEWHDDKYHPGTCGNCGWGAKSTKRNA
jgi:rRNA maturation endonuclease Nob1